VGSAVAIIGAFLGLLLVIMIHEGGHYLAARIFRFRILEYFVGFGPRLWATRRGEIEYGVKAIPAGGYVKIAGMNPLENDVPPGDEDRAYFSKPIWQRALVILAGPLSHFIVAGLIFAFLLAVFGDLSTVTRVGEVTPRIDGAISPAAAAGLRPDDVIVRIGDLVDPTPAQLGAYQEAHLGEPTTYVIERDGATIEVEMTPVVERVDGEEVPRIGVLLGPTPVPLHRALIGGYVDVWNLTTVSVGEIGRVFGPEGIGRMGELLFTDAPRRVEDPASIYGIGQQFGAVGSRGDWEQAIAMFGYVTLFIGIINLIPLPPLDGGHLALLVIERIRGRAVDLRKVIPVSAAVLVFLVTFVGAALILDITKPVPLP
jgi:membrane-associated protease RseP (regulator of RpoE activity)